MSDEILTASPEPEGDDQEASEGVLVDIAEEDLEDAPEQEDDDEPDADAA